MEQNNNELQHWGIPGMKWGVRRYQNKDGSLTPAGRKRAEKLKGEYLRVTGKQLKGRALSTKSKKTQEVKKEEKPAKKKSINDFSNDELAEATKRMNLMNDYLNASKTLSQYSPKSVSKGKKLTDLVLKEMIKPASVNIGKQAFSSLFAAGLNKGFKLEDTGYKIYTNNKRNN